VEHDGIVTEGGSFDESALAEVPGRAFGGRGGRGFPKKRKTPFVRRRGPLRNAAQQRKARKRRRCQSQKRKRLGRAFFWGGGKKKDPSPPETSGKRERINRTARGEPGSQIVEKKASRERIYLRKKNAKEVAKGQKRICSRGNATASSRVYQRQGGSFSGGSPLQEKLDKQKKRPGQFLQ